MHHLRRSKTAASTSLHMVLETEPVESSGGRAKLKSLKQIFVAKLLNFQGNNLGGWRSLRNDAGYLNCHVRKALNFNLG